MIRALGQRLTDGQLLSHRSAALLWGAPMPWVGTPTLHVTALRPAAIPRVQNVKGHTIEVDRCGAARLGGLRVTDPATTWAMLADLPLPRLVAVGDYFVRVYREGWGRRHVGQPPLATIDELTRVVSLGRWRGQPRLQEALEYVREDSWSPRESMVRLLLVQAGLPEPCLNRDVFEGDYFLGCVDMIYAEFKVAIEYQGEHHSATYTEDVERLARLRAAGWIVIEVTKRLAANPGELVRRVTAALRERGWRG